ncbi:hypothetical protein FGO68_gene5541 [Halteria grandinella]|uniref:Uncharacterized protein n=1 Tax=Halteria grandinella TaxID=5974 RepID=A0A8J8NUU7_HALGN|nr:hypothetical protein FGO68_gene5541 [Halteria grandinella]
MQFKEAQQLHFAMGPLSQGNTPKKLSSTNLARSRQLVKDIKQSPTMHHVDLNQTISIPDAMESMGSLRGSQSPDSQRKLTKSKLFRSYAGKNAMFRSKKQSQKQMAESGEGKVEMEQASKSFAQASFQKRQSVNRQGFMNKELLLSMSEGANNKGITSLNFKLIAVQPQIVNDVVVRQKPKNAPVVIKSDPKQQLISKLNHSPNKSHAELKDRYNYGVILDEQHKPTSQASFLHLTHTSMNPHYNHQSNIVTPLSLSQLSPPIISSPVKLQTLRSPEPTNDVKVGAQQLQQLFSNVLKSNVSKYEPHKQNMKDFLNQMIMKTKQRIPRRNIQDKQPNLGGQKKYQTQRDIGWNTPQVLSPIQQSHFGERSFSNYEPPMKPQKIAEEFNRNISITSKQTTRTQKAKVQSDFNRIGVQPTFSFIGTSGGGGFLAQKAIGFNNYTGILDPTQLMGKRKILLNRDRSPDNVASFSGETAIMIEGKSTMRPLRTRQKKSREASAQPSLDFTHNHLNDEVESVDTTTHKGKIIKVMLPKLNDKIETIHQDAAESLQNILPWSVSGANLTPIKSAGMKQVYKSNINNIKLQ